jgi:predicted lactoylglutathione lyase
MREAASVQGGSAPGKAAMDEMSGGYIGYVSDPDGHLWELVYPQQEPEGS